MNRPIDRILNLLYPRHCPGCAEILKDQDLLLCPSCRKSLSPITEDYCLRCGKPTAPGTEYCEDCSGRKRFFTEGRSVFVYDTRWKRSLERYKYYGYREFADFYAEAMVRCCRTNLLRGKTGHQDPGDRITEKALRRRTKAESAGSFFCTETDRRDYSSGGGRCVYYRKHHGRNGGRSSCSRCTARLFSYLLHGRPALGTADLKISLFMKEEIW